MRFGDVLATAITQIRANKLRSFFTLLGVIVSVAFLVAVVAVIQGMNAYVRERLAGAIVGVNAFQIRRDPIQVGFIDDEQWKQIQRRPIIAPEDVGFIERAVPDAEAIALQSGWPTPMADVQWRNRTTGDVFIFGVTAPYVVVQDYKFIAGEALTDVDVQQRRYVAVLGYDVAEKLFDNVEAAVGRTIRVRGIQLVVKGVIAKKGTVLGQSWDGFVMLPLSTFESMYGRRQTMVISVKMPTAGEGLIAFWAKLTRVIFNVVPIVAGIGCIVGGIVIMNIMLMSVTERTREIGIRKALGAARRDIRRQFFAEALTLSVLGGIAGLVVGFALAGLVEAISPLPARVTMWSIGLALFVSFFVGVGFGVYPAHRASRLDPIEALRQE
jgi:putative ABC transport system permease protein